MAYDSTTFKPSDRVFVQDAWEDEAGNSYDEHATIESVRGHYATLKFDTPRVNNFLKASTFRLRDLKKI